MAVKTLKPLSIVAIRDFAPNNVAYVQDSPTSPDANGIAPSIPTGVANPDDPANYPYLRLSFEDPAGTLEGTQTFQVRFSDVDYIGLHAYVYENGVQVADLGEIYGTRTTSWTFDASILSDKTGQSLQLHLEAVVYRDTTGALFILESVDAVSLTANLADAAATPPPSNSDLTANQFRTSFDEYTVGAQPSDWTPIWVTANSTYTIASASDAMGGKVMQQTATADARRCITWNAVGTISGDFDILVKFRTTDNISGNIPARVFAFVSGTSTQTTQNGYQLDCTFPQDIRIGRTTNGTYSSRVITQLGWTIQPNTWYWYRFQKSGSTLRGRMWADGATEPTTWNVTVTDTTITSGAVGVGSYDFDGTRQYDFFSVGRNGEAAPLPVLTTNITGLSPTISILDAELSVISSVRLDGAAASVSGATASLSTIEQMNGIASSLSSAQGVLSNGREMDGAAASASGANASINLLRQMDGAAASVSDVNVNVYINRGINGNSSSISDVHANPSVNRGINGVTSSLSSAEGTLLNHRIMEGASSSLSGATANLTLQREIEGASAAASDVNVNVNIIVNRSINGNSDSVSNVNAALSINRGIHGNADSISSLTSNLALAKSMDGAIASVSSQAGTIFLHHTLDGTSAAVSNVSAILLENDSLFGPLSAVAGLDAALSVEKGMAGSLTSLSSMDGAAAIQKGMIGDSEAISSLDADLDIFGKVTLAGNSPSLSGVSASLRMTKPLAGDSPSVSGVSASLQITKPLNGSVDGNAVTSGDLTVEGQLFLDGTIPSLSALSASLRANKSLVGTVQGNSSISSELIIKGELLLNGSSPSVSTLSASLKMTKALYGNSSGGSVISSGLTVEGQVFLDGGITSKSTVSSRISKKVPIYSQIAILSSIASAELTVEGFLSLSGAIISNSQLASDMKRTRGLQGVSASLSALSSALSIAGIDLLSGSIAAVSQLQGLAGISILMTGSIQESSLLYDQEPIDTWIEVDTSMYDSVSVEDDGKLLSYTIDSGVGRRIEFVFEFKVDTKNLSKLDFRIEGTQGQPFTLKAWNYQMNGWDAATLITYDGATAEQFVSLSITNINPYLDATGTFRVRMLSLNTFTSGTMTLSTDYVELIKTYVVTRAG